MVLVSHVYVTKQFDALSCYHYIFIFIFTYVCQCVLTNPATSPSPKPPVTGIPSVWNRLCASDTSTLLAQCWICMEVSFPSFSELTALTYPYLCKNSTPKKNMPARKPTIISIHFMTFFRANPIAYPRSPLPAKGIILDNKGSLLICFSFLRVF
jgi:hypothetical protein